MLKLSGIKKNYYVSDQTIEALKGLDVEFRQSEFVAVLGPSGCGKTTLMNIIGGLDQYTAGELSINGRSTSAFSDWEWDNYRNKKIGFVFQTYNLIPHQSVIANVELALTLSGYSVEERHKRAKEALEKVGLGDQLKKRPNQLSGGQMQRVAIARALVNNPDILLADEPTGALDTQTSEQIMDLLKEVSRERLVIMVTHNPDLADRFSTRIIKMIDGLITEDSMPYTAEEKEIIPQAKPHKTEKGKKIKDKTSMSFLTALSLSLKNLNTKKARTILTSFAGSIGIIGIALILAISSGINNYIDNLTTETLATNPVTIQSTGYDIDQAMNFMGNEELLEKFPELKNVLVKEARNMDDIIKRNNIDSAYVEYLKANIAAEWVNDIKYGTGININIYGLKNGSYSNMTSSSTAGMFSNGSSSGLTELGSAEFTSAQYEEIYGRMPQNKFELVAVVDEYNRISEETLISLGYKTAEDEVTEYTPDDILNKEFKILTNDQIYVAGTRIIHGPTPTTVPIYKESENIDFENAQTLKIVGIVRLRTELESGILSSGVCYTRELREWLQQQNMASDIVAWMNAEKESGRLTDPLMGISYQTQQVGSVMYTAEEQWYATMRKLGGVDVANDISIYPVDFTAKTNILNVLNQWNRDNQTQIITYTDMAAILGKVITQMVNYISYALIAFTAVSLLVSSVMIGIITYISVLERTKEIGILRAIGARKKDITRVFNAETFLIGLLAGIIGIVVTYLVSIPINIIVYNLAEVKQLASLPFYYGIILIFVSVALTLISGLIPAFKAAKKDPVLALRTE